MKQFLPLSQTDSELTYRSIFLICSSSAIKPLHVSYLSTRGSLSRQLLHQTLTLAYVASRCWQSSSLFCMCNLNLNDINELTKFQMCQIRYIIQKIEFMENSQSGYIVSPKNILLNQNDPIIKFYVRNTSNRSCHYQLFTPDSDHFRILNPRTFTLAPGITKSIRIQHTDSSKCSSLPQIIQVVDENGNRSYVNFRCFKHEEVDNKKIDIENDITLEKMKVHEEKQIEIPFRNVSSSNLKLKLKYAIENNQSEIVQVRLEDEQIIVLKDSSKKIRLNIKVAKQVEFVIWLLLQFTQQFNKEKWEENVKISGNSQIRSQFVADQKLNRLDCMSHQFLNGTSISGSFFLVNNYHKPCLFKLFEVIEIIDYKSYCDKLQELSLRLEIREGVLQSKSQKEICYTLNTNLSDNDRSFTYRYSQLSTKDEGNAYKLRNSNFFKKNLQASLRVQFGEDNPIVFKLKAHIMNPALKISKTSHNNIDTFDILNDTGLEIPYKFTSNLYYIPKNPKGKIKPGSNFLQIQWRKVPNQSITKQNFGETLKCAVKLEIPKNEMILFEPASLQRPKTAYLKCSSISKQNLRQKISLRAPTKSGSVGVKSLKQVSQQDYSVQPFKYIKGEIFDQDQFKFLQINQNERGNVITNFHKNKNIVAYFPQKGYFRLECQHSYLFPYERKSLKFQLFGRIFEIKSKQIEDKQPYKILKRELLFCFHQNQKQFQVVREVQVVNKSNNYLMMYCLSVDDDYFHSLQQQNKILIPPKQTHSFKINFYPKAEIRLKDNKILRTLQFLINNQKELITCEGDFLSADIVIDQKRLQFNNCRYSNEEITKRITLTNKGLNKVMFSIEHSENIKITPKSAIINQKNKMNILISFCPSKLPKLYEEDIQIYFKGSHSIKIPLKVTTLQPEIECRQSIIDFKEGYQNESLTSSITIMNKNNYSCSLTFQIGQTNLKGPMNVEIGPGASKTVQFELELKDVGERIVKLPANFIQLCGYGAIRGPTLYKFIGKKTLMQLMPDNAFSKVVFAQIQQIKTLKIKNLSNSTHEFKVILTSEQRYQNIILSCEPNTIKLVSGEQKTFKLHSIRNDEDDFQQQSKFYKYNLSFYLEGGQRCRSIDFDVEVPPPQLEICPKQIYFPLVPCGSWSKTNFKIINKGYKQVLVAIKKPANVNFQLDYKIENESNKLTRLNNEMQIAVFYKSKKTVSFSVIFEIQDNFRQKYQIKLFGTTSNSPLLNCQKMISSTSKGFSSKEIKGSSKFVSLNSFNADQSNSDTEDSSRFINRWLWGVLPQFSKDNQIYNIWLRNPRNLFYFLKYLRIDILILPKDQFSLQFILQELKKMGFPIYTIRLSKLNEGCLTQWSMLIWFLLSKELIHQQTLKWVNKICGINIQTYQSAFAHHKKILTDIISRLFQPIFKGKVTQLQKMIEYLQPSMPVLSKIQNKRQFIIAINILYLKFHRTTRQKVHKENFQHSMKLQNNDKFKKSYWIASNNQFQVQTGHNCSNTKYISQKKMFSCSVDGQDTVTLKIKDQMNIAFWNNSLYDPIKIYQLELTKKIPNIHSIIIECEDKCSQEWKLLFRCEIQCEYFFQFSGGLQFKCKMPDLGVIKAGEVMQFRVIYSPSNLKQHSGVLKISNKYEENIYNLKGKPLRSNYVEIQRFIRIPQNQRYVQMFSITQEADVRDHSYYKVIEVGQKTQQLISVDAKSNKKEILIQIALQFSRIIQNKEIILQVVNEQLTFSKNIRLVINVIPKPIIIKAQMKGIIDRAIVEKIPITNSLPIKQNCFITLRRITREQYENSNSHQLEHQERHSTQHNLEEWEFKLSNIGKMALKPGQKININLRYLPLTLTQNYCQIRIKMEGTQGIIVYNFVGMPQLPYTDNPTIVINCQCEQQSIETLKIPNRLKEKISFDVETNIPFIAGQEQITLNSRQSFLYTFKVLPLHAGEFDGELNFKNEKFCLVYPLKIIVVNKKKIRKIQVQSKVRVTSKIEIQLSNKSDKQIHYEVQCTSDYLRFQPKFILEANSQKALVLNYTPLFAGVKLAQLKLYNQNMQEIIYNLEMVSQDHKESLKFNCLLGEKKKIKICLKNPTDKNAKIQDLKLPKQLSCQSDLSTFIIPCYSVANLQLIYTQFSLQQEFRYTLQVITAEVGNFNYDLIMTSDIIKKMPPSVILYESSILESIKRQCFLEILNYFDQILEFNIEALSLQMNNNCKLNVDSPAKFQLKPYEKKRVKCQVTINSTENQEHLAIDQSKKSVIIRAKQFSWIFPIEVVKIFQMKNTVSISGSIHELAKTRISLKHVKMIKNWCINEIPSFKDNFNLSFISSKDVYLETIMNKNFDFNGTLIFYDDDMTCAEKYHLSVKIEGKKYEKVWISANVGEKGKAEIRLKNGRGKYQVELKNNKMKEFGVEPMKGQFKENGDNIIYFEYCPVEYNGNKRAEVIINSEYGSFNFYILGKFPKLK